MKKQDLMKKQGPTCVLRVDIHCECEGCKSKVRKILKKIDGVYKTSIDVEQGKVTVTGNVDPAVLIRKLEKSGKHAELWSSQKGSNNTKNIQFDILNNQFKNLQMGNGKGVGSDKKKDGGGYQQAAYQQSMQQQMKGSKDLKAPFNMKDHKRVKFDLPKKGADDYDDFSEDDFEDDDDEFDDFDDELDDFDDEFDDFDDDFDHGAHQKQKKGMPIMDKGKVAGKDNKGRNGGGGGGAKKASSGIVSMIGKAMGGKGEGKYGNEGKKGGGGGPKNGGWEGKNGNKGGGRGGHGSGAHFNGGGVKGNINGNGGGKKGGGGKNGGFPDFEVNSHHKGGGRGGGMGQYHQIPAAQGRPPAPMMNMNGGGGGGYHPGMVPMPANPHQQQQYMAMMNQQRMMGGGGGGGGGMYHQAVYGRPPPGYGYAPPMPPPVYHDPLTHMFSDENTSSCSIM